MNATDKFQAQQYLANDGLLSKFMPRSQRFFIRDAINGEEGDHFIQKVLEIVKVIRGTPMTYQTEGTNSQDKVLHLHYFKGGVDAWIIERDVGDSGNPSFPGAGEGDQTQAYGRVSLFGGGWEDGEWGYVSIDDLIANGVELDLYWEPKTVRKMA